MMSTVLLIDDHDIVRFGLETLLKCDGLEMAAGAGSLSDGLRAIAAIRPDLVITDMGLGDSQGLETVRQAVAAQGPRPVLVVSMQDEMLYGEQVLALGAAGYVMKETAYANIVPAARAALAGERWISPRLASRIAAKLCRRNGTAATAAPAACSLTAREIEILELLKRGKTTKEIASALDLGVRTVDFHRANIKQKLELRSGAELIAFASSRL